MIGFYGEVTVRDATTEVDTVSCASSPTGKEQYLVLVN